MASLTQIKVNPRSRHAQRDLGDSHGMHQRVMRLLPDGAGVEDLRARTSTLHRLDRFPDGSIHLLVQSGLDTLAVDTLPEGYAITAPRTISLDPFHASLSVGERVRYAITVNPTKSISTPERGARSKRITLTGYDDVHQWWARKAEAAGVELVGLPRIDPAIQPTGTRQGQSVRHRAFRIEGVARVGQPDLLRAALVSGIGRGRAYGLGLMTVARTG